MDEKVKIMEPEELLQKIKKDEIHWKEAFEIFIKMSTKPWQSTIWKNNRKLHLKNYCEKCNTDVGPFVIQHLSHQPFYESIYKELVNISFEKYIVKKNIKIPPVIVPNQEMCPKCSSINLRGRKTVSPKYHCNKCSFEFDEVKIGDYKKYDVDHLFKSKLKKQFEEDISEIIRKKAIIISIKKYINYISLEGTITLCKKCAFLMDKKGLVLCKKCGKNYHTFLYEQCFECYSGRKYDPKKDGNSLEIDFYKYLQMDDDFTFI